MTDFAEIFSKKLSQKIFGYLNIRQRCKIECVSKKWYHLIQETYGRGAKQIWVYTMFRKGMQGGHEKMNVIFSYHGPVFWGRQIVYVNVCCCHFQNHELGYKSLCRKLGQQVNRICIVDTPVNYPYLTDEFYRFTLDAMPNLEWIYLREIDLEPISWATVQRLAVHPTLKKIVVHWCRNYDALENFGTLKQLMICNGPIEGLKYLEELDAHLKKELSWAYDYDFDEGGDEKSPAPEQSVGNS